MPKSSREKEIQKLIMDNINLVHYVVNEMCNIPPHLREDAISEGYLALCRAARKYKKSVGVNFSTYACVVISRQIFYFVRKSVLSDERQKEYAKYVLDKMSRMAESKEDSTTSMLDTMLRQSAGDVLSRIIAEKMQGKTIRQISKMLGINQNTVTRLLSKWRREYADQ